MKKISLSAALITAFIFASFIAFGVHSTYQMDMNDMSSASSQNPCTFMGEALLCSMSPLEHMQYFRNFFAGNIPQSLLATTLFFASAIFVFYLWRLFQIQACPNRPHDKLRRIFLNPVLRTFTKIHQRLYA